MNKINNGIATETATELSKTTIKLINDFEHYFINNETFKIDGLEYIYNKHWSAIELWYDDVYFGKIDLLIDIVVNMKTINDTNANYYSINTGMELSDDRTAQHCIGHCIYGIILSFLSMHHINHE